MKALIGMKTDPPVKSRPVVARPVKALIVSLGDNVPETPVEGRVDALYRISLFAEVNGVLSIGGKEFREGTRYRAGEVVLRLDDSELRASLVAQRSAFLQTLSTSLADLQTDFPGSAQVWLDYAAQMQVDATLPDLPEPADQRERLFLANRGILATYHNIRSAEERLSKYSIVAPFDGVLTEAMVQPGALVRAGQPMGTLVGIGDFEVKTAVHARYLPAISRGDSVAFFEENGQQVAVGEVKRLASNVDASTQSASVFCQIRSASAFDALRDGRYLSGKIYCQAIPESMALRVDLLNDEDMLFTIEKNAEGEQVLRERKVVVLFRSQDEAVVSGLAPGAQILAEPMNGSYDGLPVNIVE